MSDTTIMEIRLIEDNYIFFKEKYNIKKRAQIKKFMNDLKNNTSINLLVSDDWFY